MRQVIMATNNAHKLREIRQILGDEFTVKIKNFISIVGVDFGQVKKYLSLFPDRVYRNIYQGGLMNELV